MIKSQLQPFYVVDTESERSTGWLDGSRCFCKDSEKTYILVGGVFKQAMPSGSGAGDMEKSVYDTDNDGKVDNAENVSDGTNVSTAAEVKGAVTNSPAADEKAALAGTSGTPSGTNKYVTNADSRNTDARTPTTHGHAESDITNLVDDLAAKETPTGAQAKVDAHKDLTTGVHGAGVSTIATTGNITTHAAVTASVHNFDVSGNAPAQAHLLGGSVHSTDTLANLNTKISDADVVALAGQLGGTAASPDVRGLRESGGQLLTMGAVVDGQYLLRSGITIASGSPGGGSPPAWKGNIAAAWGDGDPAPALRHMQAAGVVSPTPTNISITVARVAFFKLDTILVLNKFRFYGVGATTGLYRVAIYPAAAASAKLVGVDDFNTAAAAWGAAGSALNITLVANTLYVLAVAVDTVGTTAGILALGPAITTTTGMMVLPTGWPGNLDFDAASPKIAPFGFAQFAVTAGALPATLPTLVNQAAWAGGMPAFFLDNNNA